MLLKQLDLEFNQSSTEKALDSLAKSGIITVADWKSRSRETLEQIPNLSRKLLNEINRVISTTHSDQDLKSVFLWQGEIFNDDRLFILDLQPAKKGNLDVWAVVTRWNSSGFSPYKVNDFPTKLEAIKFIKKIEPQTPRISLGGKSPDPVPTYLEYLDLLRKNGEPSAYQIHEDNKHQQRTLILDEGNC